MELFFRYYKTIITTLGVTYLITAVLLLFMSNWLIHVNRVLKRWVSMQKVAKALDTVRDIDEHIFGMRKVLGILSLGIGLLFLLVFL